MFKMFYILVNQLFYTTDLTVSRTGGSP